jgi:hypothetical protein
MFLAYGQLCSMCSLDSLLPYELYGKPCIANAKSSD